MKNDVWLNLLLNLLIELGSDGIKQAKSNVPIGRLAAPRTVWLQLKNHLLSAPNTVLTQHSLNTQKANRT